MAAKLYALKSFKLFEFFEFTFNGNYYRTLPIGTIKSFGIPLSFDQDNNTKPLVGNTRCRKASSLKDRIADVKSAIYLVS